MNALTLDQVLTDAENLPLDEREMLEDLLRKRRIDSWRVETTAPTAFRAGKLKPQPVEDIIAHLRAAK